MTRKPNPLRTRTVSREAGAALAALDGATITELVHEEVTDPLFPEAPAVVNDDEVTASVMIPRRYLKAECPDCGGPRSEHGIDALVFDHDERCEVGAALDAQLRRDAGVIARKVGRGEPPQRSRTSTREELWCLADRGLTPPTRCTTVRLNAQGQPVRSWRWLDHEPDLAAS
ncbi:hypothetical protein ACUN7V_15465 [Quadrisphaera oryzae]|uniref:hypothetical protein n=1 Tax=Quadrisphaera TaxID=317661 RepID=UPI001644A262|nr:hypothetical protein [Quadrisphaera sp. RL12-1S]MBC3760609.1 hypothetical protein [Quadrisphaera sp. RL12-1S]